MCAFLECSKGAPLLLFRKVFVFSIYSCARSFIRRHIAVNIATLRKRYIVIKIGRVIPVEFWLAGLKNNARSLREKHRIKIVHVSSPLQHHLSIFLHLERALTSILCSRQFSKNCIRARSILCSRSFSKNCIYHFGCLQLDWICCSQTVIYIAVDWGLLAVSHSCFPFCFC